MSDFPIHVMIEAVGDMRRLIIDGPQKTEDREAWRKVHHDYLAAMRSLRYLAQKGLQNPLDTPEQTVQKKESLDRHLKQLERFEQAVIQPLLQELPRSLTDASP